MRAVLAVGAWRAAGVAMIACTLSWGPQPVAAAAGRDATVRLVIAPVVQRHLLRLYAAYRNLPVTSIAPPGLGRCWAPGSRAA
jgi:hypothetical protein